MQSSRAVARPPDPDAAARPERDAAVSVADNQLEAEDAGVCEANGCECSQGETRACYSGAAQTLGRGRCAAGVATCVAGSFGACQGERLPAYETCANAGVDDDCDGKLDEGLSLGMPCMAAGLRGLCAHGVLQCQNADSAPVCVTGSAVAESCNALDDDCDGQTDEAFVLTNDPQHCGRCGTACASGEVCCGGQCQGALPEDFGAQCGGACDTPGTVQCDGSCSKPEPENYGVRCSDGISTVGCSGSCECERQCPGGQIVACASLCPILCIGNICIEL